MSVRIYFIFITMHIIFLACAFMYFNVQKRSKKFKGNTYDKYCKLQ